MITVENLPWLKKMWRRKRFFDNVNTQRKMDVVITLTEEDADFWSKFFKNIVIIPNFIDSKKIVTSELRNKDIIAVGRLEKEKDFFSMITAFVAVKNTHPDWKLKIYGDGSLKNDLQAHIKKLDLENNVFICEPVKDIFSKYLESSIYLHTAFYEGFPNSLLEAMTHGLPSVVFESVGGVKVLAANNINSFVIKNRKVDDISKHILTLIENETLRRKMGAESRKTAESYSVENIMEKWHNFYQNL